MVCRKWIKYMWWLEKELPKCAHIFECFVPTLWTIWKGLEDRDLLEKVWPWWRTCVTGDVLSDFKNPSQIQSCSLCLQLMNQMWALTYCTSPMPICLSSHSPPWQLSNNPLKLWVSYYLQLNAFFCKMPWSWFLYIEQ